MNIEKNLGLKIALVVIIIVAVLLGGIFYVKYYVSKTFPKINPGMALENLKDTFSKEEAKPKETLDGAFNQNNFDLANKLADENLAKNQKSVEALLAKASILAQQASLTFKEKELGDEARTYVLKALDLDPNNLDALVLLGYTYEIQEDFKNAHKYYDEAIVIDENFAKALDQKAHAYDLQGQVTKAETFYNKAIKADPSYVKSYAGLARIYMTLGKFKEAQPLLQNVLDNADNNRSKAEAAYSLGVINETKEYSKKSADYYTQAINLDPSYSLAYVGSAKEDFANKQPEQSFAKLAKALEINPHQTAAAIQLGLQYAAIGDKDTAIKILEKVKTEIPKDISLSKVGKNVMLATTNSLIKIISTKTK